MIQWQAEQTQPGVWVFTWTPTTGHIYEIWLNGVLLETTEAGVGTYTASYSQTDEAPPIEIHDTSSGTAENEAYPPVAVLQWYGIPNASSYTVERYISSVWIQVANITENGSGWYVYNTGYIGDQALTQFRVTALDYRSLGGTPVEFDVYLVCNPAPPDVVIDATAGDVTVGAA